jgi:hypothetical protein
MKELRRFIKMVVCRRVTTGSIFRSRWRSCSGVLISMAILGLSNFVQPLSAIPVTLIINNPHQTIARPTSGTVVLNFTGTVSFGPDFEFEEAILDIDYNHSSTSGIPTEFGPLNFSKADNGGSVSGILFTAEVSSSTVPGFYGFHFGTGDDASFSIEGANGEEFVTKSRPFSIRVTNGTAVSDASNSALLLCVSCVGLFFVQCKLS